MGYAKGPVAAPRRGTIGEIIHYETYDLNKFRSYDQLSGFIKSRTLQGAYGLRGGAERDETS